MAEKKLSTNTVETGNSKANFISKYTNGQGRRDKGVGGASAPVTGSVNEPLLTHGKYVLFEGHYEYV